MVDDELPALLLAYFCIFALASLQNCRASKTVCFNGFFSLEKFDLSFQSVLDFLNFLVDFLSRKLCVVDELLFLESQFQSILKIVFRLFIPNTLLNFPDLVDD